MMASCASQAKVHLVPDGRSIVVQRPALYPETIEYDDTTRKFLLGSFRDGGVYSVDDAGNVSRRVDDPRLCSVLGIAVDRQRGTLWAVNADLGASERTSPGGPKTLAGVGIYELASGKPLTYVDVTPLATGEHLLNGIALDTSGNAYVTDSFSPVIYKVDPTGHASVFVSSPEFTGNGVNLNGVVVHPDGYLLVIKKSDGVLFRVPLDAPTHFSKVRTQERFIGGDGLLLAGKTGLLLIANQIPHVRTNRAFSLSSSDAFESAEVRAAQDLGDGYPTTAAVRGGEIYVVSSKLNELIQSPREKKQELQERATLRVIGSIER
jgi:sugar lactone lactonase YvrE